jgi:hypothetical protein
VKKLGTMRQTKQGVRARLVCGWPQPGSHAADRPALARLARCESGLFGSRTHACRLGSDAVWLPSHLAQK